MVGALSLLLFVLLIEAIMAMSLKFYRIVTQPIKQKSVTNLAGIHKVLGTRLRNKKYDKAYNVLGQFLTLNKDKELFRNWLKEACNANKKQQFDCSS